MNITLTLSEAVVIVVGNFLTIAFWAGFLWANQQDVQNRLSRIERLIDDRTRLDK